MLYQSINFSPVYLCLVRETSFALRIMDKFGSLKSLNVVQVAFFHIQVCKDKPFLTKTSFYLLPNKFQTKPTVFNYCLLCYHKYPAEALLLYS